MSNKAVTREGRKSNAILRTAFQKSESSTSSSQYEARQRCNVWPSKSRTDRKRLNTRSFFAALKRECKKTFHNSTSERQLSTSTTPRSTSTTPVSTSTTSTSTTFSSSTSTTSIDAGARVSVKAEHAAAANAELQERIDEIQAKLTAKYSGRDVSSTSTGSQGYYGVNTTSTTRSTSTTPSLLTSSSTTKVSTSSTRLSSSTSTEFMISTSTTSLSSSFRRIPASTSSTAVRTSRSKKSAAARFQLNMGSSSTSRVVVDNRQNNDTFRSLSRKDSSSSSADWMRSRKGKSKKSAAARFQNL